MNRMPHTAAQLLMVPALRAQVLDHYERTVKPAFTCFVEPTKQWAHIILPRGLDNTVATDLIQQHIAWRLSERAAA